MTSCTHLLADKRLSDHLAQRGLPIAIAACGHARPVRSVTDDLEVVTCRECLEAYVAWRRAKDEDDDEGADEATNGGAESSMVLAMVLAIVPPDFEVEEGWPDAIESLDGADERLFAGLVAARGAVPPDLAGLIDAIGSLVCRACRAAKDLPEEPEEADTYEEMPLKELKAHAKDLGLRGYSKLKKAQLVDLLREAATW